MTIKDILQKYEINKDGIFYKWEVSNNVIYWVEGEVFTLYQKRMNEFLEDLEAVLNEVDEDAQRKVDEIRNILGYK